MLRSLKDWVHSRLTALGDGSSSLANSYRQRQLDNAKERKKHWNPLLWAAVFFILIGANLASWSFFLYVSGYPEVPWNYRLLKRFDQLPELPSFRPETAPRGTFQSTRELFSLLGGLELEDLAQYNRKLKRRFARSFSQEEGVLYLSDTITVTEVRLLSEADPFYPGLVVKGRSVEFPAGFVELVLPTKEVMTSSAQEVNAIIGQELAIGESVDCAAVMHLHRGQSGAWAVSCLPLVTGEFPVGDFIIEIAVTDSYQPEPLLWPLFP